MLQPDLLTNAALTPNTTRARVGVVSRSPFHAPNRISTNRYRFFSVAVDRQKLLPP